MKLYLVRHGQTDMNKEKLYYGWTDCPINEVGRKQAQTLYEFFKNVECHKVITSDLKRSIETAEIITKGKNIVFDKRQAFRELNFGLWEGKHYKILKQEYPEAFEQWGKDWKNFCIPEGEAFFTFYERIRKELEKVIAETSEKENVLLVTHNGVMSAMLCVLTGAGYDGFWKFFLEQETYSLVSVKNGMITIEKINCPVKN